MEERSIGIDGAGQVAHEVIVRPIEAGDRAAWEEMWQAYNVFYHVSVPDSATEATWARIMNATSPVHAILAVDHTGTAWGLANYILHPYTWSDRPSCLMEDLFVRPEARGRGVGRALIDHLVQLSKEHGWGRLYWVTQRENATARRLYDHYTTVSDYVQYAISFDNVRPLLEER